MKEKTIFYKSQAKSDANSSQVSITESIFRKANTFFARLGSRVFSDLSSNARYLMVGFLIIVTAISLWTLSKPRSNPDLLARPPLSLSWWTNPIERGAVLRLPIISASGKPKGSAISDDTVVLAFGNMPPENTGLVSITADGFVQAKFGADNSWIYSINGKELIELDITFDYYSSTVNKNEINDIKRVAERSKLLPNAAILLEGHSSTRENKDPDIGYRRANAVKDLLLKFGVESKQIIFTSFDSEDPGVPKTDKNYPNVELKFAGDLPPKKPTEALEWKEIPPADTDTEVLVLNGNWALGGDRGIILYRSGEQPWQTKAVTKEYAQKYLEQREPGYIFDFTGNAFRWQKKNAEATKGANQWATEYFHKAYPAPLAYLVTIIFGLTALIIISAKAGPETIDPTNNVVEHFASDAPIKTAGSDCLGFNRIARSISQFLRNEKTIPPLTISVTGQWGSGKSSLMQLLFSDLKAHKIHPIWLNAWHHQNESQFLYGLLNAIRSHGMPSFLSSAHLLFRIRLLISRIRQKPYYILFLAALLAIPLGIYYSLIEHGNVMQSWSMLLQTMEELMAARTTNPFILGLVNLLTEKLLVFGTTIPFLLGLKNFSGEKLTNLASGKLKKNLFSLTSSEVDLRSSVGVREKFVQEFQHFCNAMGVSTLTIFIDDLDRCSEKRIMDVLETVNFLVSSGKCIIVFGMDRDPVERAVANYYRQSYNSSNQKELIHFARRYLEKLVNIEVPVPTTKDQNITQLVAPGLKEKTHAKQILTLSAYFMILLGISWFSLFAGVFIGDFVTYKTQTPEKANQRDLPNTPQNAISEDRTIERSSADLEIISAKDSTRAHYLYTFLPATILLFLAGAITLENYQQRKRVLVHDSKPFSSAVDDWMQLMGDRNATPRRIKRFVNRARFLTMRLRNDSQSGMKETNLVTMAGLHELDASLLDILQEGDQQNFIQIMEKKIPQGKTILNKILAHWNRYQQNKVVDTFKSWVQGVDIR